MKLLFSHSSSDYIDLLLKSPTQYKLSSTGLIFTKSIHPHHVNKGRFWSSTSSTDHKFFFTLILKAQQRYLVLQLQSKPSTQVNPRRAMLTVPSCILDTRSASSTPVV